MGRNDGSSLKGVAEQVRSTSKKAVEKPRANMRVTIPTGLTGLNLALADNPFYGYVPGSIINIVGDTHSGKTTLALLCLAACAYDKSLKDYRLVYDSAEPLIGLDVKKLYGKKTYRRIKPMHEGASPDYSRTVEDLTFGLTNLLDIGEPFIAIIDSLDALTSEDDLAYEEKKRKAWEKGEDVSGSYGMAKAKMMSAMFRNIADRIEQTDSLVIIISQTRDNINPMSFKKKTRSGGKALDFYAHIIMWLAHIKNIPKKVRGVNYNVGSKTRTSIDKNKYTGKRRKVEFDTYYDYGVDDIGGMVDWLTSNEIWKKSKGIHAEEFDFSGSREKLIAHVEENNLEDELKEIVGKYYAELEVNLRLGRKDRF